MAMALNFSDRVPCPDCGQDMVRAVFTVGTQAVRAWICNCREQPDGICADVENARLDPLTVLTYEVTDGKKPAPESD